MALLQTNKWNKNIFKGLAELNFNYLLGRKDVEKYQTETSESNRKV